MHNSCHAQQLREKSQRQQSELPRQSGCSPSPLHPVTPSTPRLSSLAPPLTVHATSSSRCESCRDFRVCGQERHTHIPGTAQLQTCDTLLCPMQDGPGTAQQECGHTPVRLSLSQPLRLRIILRGSNKVKLQVLSQQKLNPTVLHLGRPRDGMLASLGLRENVQVTVQRA